MIIANPIYDVVFKYLLEDKAIAKTFISALIDKEVLELSPRPQEVTVGVSKNSTLEGSKASEPFFTVYRMDFVARIDTPQGSQLVTIEIQKAKFATDIMRFRQYIGQQYSNPENYYRQQKGNDLVKKPLPIISIYFLGYELEELAGRPVIRVARSYIDVHRKEAIETSCEFIESLTHDSVIISIPALAGHRRNGLEQLLGVFDQSQKTWDHHLLVVPDEGLTDVGIKIVRRLQKAAEIEQIQKTMTVEDELLEFLEENERILTNKDKIIEEKDQVIEEKDRIIAELKQKLGLK